MKSDTRTLEMQPDCESSSESSTDEERVTPISKSKKIFGCLKIGSSCAGIYVRRSHNTDLKRVYDKYQYCIFCSINDGKSAKVLDIRKHLFRKHKNEKEVAEILAIPTGMAERKLYLEKLRNKGNYIHNVEVLRNGNGEIIPYRCPSNYIPYTNFVPCRHCFGFFQKKDLWKHKRNCFFNRDHCKNSKETINEDASVLLPPPFCIKSALQECVISRMLQDKITLLAKNDSLIIRFGEKLWQKLSDCDDRHIQVSQKLRELGRFMLEIRKADAYLSNLTKTLVPENFSCIVQAVRKVAGFEAVSCQYRIPSLALKLGHSLSKCCLIKEAIALETNNHELENEAKSFLRCMKLNYTDEISRTALRNLKQKKWNNPTVMAIAEDIMKLQKYLQQEMKLAKVQLQKEVTKNNWKALARLALSSLILFNRKRSGEASKVKLEMYSKKNTETFRSDIVSTLTPIEKEICKNYPRIEIQGKRGRKVPLIFPPNLIDIIDLLVMYRKEVGINETNPYLFPYPHDNADTHIRGHDCLRTLAKNSKAKFPETLTGISLRKHIATFSQILNLTNHELEQLANFMGHDIRVHRDFYRLPEDVYQLAKTGKMLVALDEGKFAQFNDKSMADISVDLEEHLEDIFSNKFSDESPNNKEKRFNTYNCEVNKLKVNKSRNAFGNKGTLSLCVSGNNSEHTESGSELVSSTKEDTEDVKEYKRKRSRFTRYAYSKQEKDEIWRAFTPLYKLGKLPGKSDITTVQENVPALKTLPWEKIKQVCRRQLKSFEVYAK